MSKKECTGFTLPTVMLASVIMLALLTMALQVASTSAGALQDQYYRQTAREAAESGATKAQSCLKHNNYIPQWSKDKPLRPNTDCRGDVISGASEYIVSQDNIKTSFIVASSDTLANGVQQIFSEGSSYLSRSSDKKVRRTYKVNASAVVSAEVTFNNIAFGYRGEQGAFFGVIDHKGDVLAQGFNDDGQLGNGTRKSITTPQLFRIPGNKRVVGLFTNFLSLGFTMFAVTSDGQVYGAGSNKHGQLGIGRKSESESTPQQFGLPNNVKARFVNNLVNSTFVIGNDHNIYSAGICNRGQLGSNYRTRDCSDQYSYKRVALPQPNISDQNTIPVEKGDWVQATNLVADSESVFVRMVGGRVYGWGANNTGQLANGSATDSSQPVQLGEFGNKDKPKAIQLAFDGVTVYILGDDGDLMTSGANWYGALGGASSAISSAASNKGSRICIDNPNNGTSANRNAAMRSCDGGTAQNIEWQSDLTLRFRPDSQTELCMEGVSISVSLRNCNNSSSQKWKMEDDRSIRNVSTGKCLTTSSQGFFSTRDVLHVENCRKKAARQQWILNDARTLRRLPMPKSAGKIKRVTTDQWATLYLTENGEVWGAGINNKGVLGNGESLRHTPYLTKFKLPENLKAVDVYTTKTGDVNAAYSNTYVIADDGSVWGAGGNTFGQLGIGHASNYESTPQKMRLPEGVHAKSVQTGLGTTVILSDKGRIYTVGNNSHGQLGDGTRNSSYIPQANKYTNTIPVRFY